MFLVRYPVTPFKKMTELNGGIRHAGDCAGVRVIAPKFKRTVKDAANKI